MGSTLPNSRVSPNVLGHIFHRLTPCTLHDPQVTGTRMMLSGHSVLFQWLPSQSLRSDRLLSGLGAKYGSEVQQTPIKFFSPQYAMAAALADCIHGSYEPDGTRRIKVGFDAPTRFDGTGWVLDTGAPMAAKVTYFDDAPTHEELVESTLRAFVGTGEGSKGRRKAVLDRAKEIERRKQQMIVENREQVAREAAEKGIFFDLDKFNAVAGVVGFDDEGEIVVKGGPEMLPGLLAGAPRGPGGGSQRAMPLVAQEGSEVGLAGAVETADTPA